MSPSKTNRRTLVVVALVAAAGLAGSAVVGVRLARIMFGGDVRADASGRPNLLLVTLDTCRRDRLSLYGHERDTTPALIGLAEDALVFDNAFTVATNSAPSHATILTGLYPFGHGLVDNGLRLPEEVPTLAEFLALAGYDTAAFVGYYALGRESGLDQGFDTFELHELDDHGHDARDLENETRSFAAVLEWLRGPREREEQGSESVDASSEAPFFVWLHAQQMHDADPPAPYDGYFMQVPREHAVPGFDEGEFDIRCFHDVLQAFLDGNLTAELEAQTMALYDGEVRLVDDHLAKLFSYLEEAGLYDDTVIVIVADHGELFFERPPGGAAGHVEPGHTGKYLDAVMRIPMIVKPTAGSDLAVGRRIEPMVSSVDVVPTILELLDYERFPWLEGRSLVSTMLAPEVLPEDERVLFQEVPYEVSFAGVRTREWKLVMKTKRKRRQVLLVDLANDPDELVNAAGSFSDRAASLQRLVEDWLARQKTAGRSSYADMSREMREALRRAGYIRDRAP